MHARILIVDDHEVVRRGLRSLLEAESWSVCGEAGDGDEAIEMVRELRPDVVTMDISMPVKDGIQAAREILQILPATKIIMLSMHDSPRFAEEARQAGAHAYVVKSESADRLHETIVRVLNDRGLVRYA